MPNHEENKPLDGVNIVITRALDQTGDETDVLTNNGANLIFYPSIETRLHEDAEEFIKDLQDLNNFDFILFSSVNAVRFFIETLEKLNIPFPQNCKIGAVGDKTAAKLKEYNINTDVIPDNFTAEGMLDVLSETGVAGKKILLPQSAIARPVLKEGLAKLGADVTVFPLYQTVIPDEEIYREAKIELHKLDSFLFLFTSPSTFDNFLKIEEITNAPEYFRDHKIAVIGSITQAAIEKAGVSVDIIPDKFTMENLVEKVLNYYSK